MNPDDTAVADAKSRIQELLPPAAIAERAEGDTLFLDVREQKEWNLFRIPGAEHIPLAALVQRVRDEITPERRVIVYCASGNRSALAADQMQQLGYADVVSLADGIRGWMNAGGELEE